MTRGRRRRTRPRRTRRTRTRTRTRRKRNRSSNKWSDCLEEGPAVSVSCCCCQHNPPQTKPGRARSRREKSRSRSKTEATLIKVLKPANGPRCCPLLQILSESSRHGLSQTIKAGELKFYVFETFFCLF